jgi:hypothetical protein
MVISLSVISFIVLRNSFIVLGNSFILLGNYFILLGNYFIRKLFYADHAYQITTCPLPPPPILKPSTSSLSPKFHPFSIFTV